MKDQAEKTVDRRGESVEIDLSKLILAYVRKWWLIVLCTVITTTVTLVYTARFVVPMYQATVSIYVNNIRQEETINYLSDSNLNASQRLVKTYIEIVKSDRVMEKVSARLNGEYSAGQLKGMLSASSVAETEMFRISVHSPDPKEAARIANIVAEVVPDTITEIIVGSSARVVDYAKVPGAPSSPNWKRNTMEGILVGLFIALAYLTIQYLTDVHIKGDEDLAAISQIPILGRIPAFEQIEKKEGPTKKDASEKPTAVTKQEEKTGE